MNTKLFLSVMLVVACSGVRPAAAIKTAPNMHVSWEYNDNKATYGAAPQFILDGGLGKTKRGTWDDEFGLVGMVATALVEHGGYFCPYQVQCSNSNGSAKTWTTYYKPTGFNKNKCAWLCETGYAGVNCERRELPPAAQDTTSLQTKFSGVSMTQSGSNVESDVVGFAQWGSDPEHDVVLGAVSILEHGVIAGPVQIKCARTQSRYVIDSWVDSVSLASQKQKLLCAEGFMANSSGTDCVLIDPNAYGIALLNFCDGFPREDYDSAKHTLITDTCTKYFCADSDLGFANSNTKDCTQCATAINGGISTKDGTCIKCASGQYFDQGTNSCQLADAYSKIDMQYGKGKTRATNSDVNNQCWPIAMPDEYTDCVKAGGKANIAKL